MIKIIAAMGLDRCIGLTNEPRLPWDQSLVAGDLKRFSEITKNSVVIMGRRTWQSLGSKPLKDRLNYVIAKEIVFCASQEDAPHGICETVQDAIKHAKENHSDKNIFLIGGERIFKEGQRFADEIDLTVVPFKGYESYCIESLVYFPRIDEKFKNRMSFTHPENPSLRILKYS